MKNSSENRRIKFKEMKVDGETVFIDVKLDPKFKKMYSRKYLKTSLIKVPSELGLTPHLDTVKLKGLPIDGTKKKGYTGFVLLTQSHLYCFHSWPENQYIHFELSSCKKVSRRKVAKVISELFPVVKMKIRKTSWNLDSDLSLSEVKNHG